MIDQARLQKVLESEPEERFGLPDTLQRHSVNRTKTDMCAVCQIQFSMVSLFGVGQRDYFCKYCGNAVCENCSRNKKYLSKDATERLRVCDLCDCKLDNMRNKIGLDRII